jgi:shikimate dehydrogenase
VKITDGKLTGHNTDIPGFRDSLAAVYPHPPGGKALVAGTGGASRSVVCALNKYFEFDRIDVVSRTPSQDQWSYQTVQRTGLGDYFLIVNTTPLGQTPDVHSKPALPYDTLTPGQVLYDLVYNPVMTQFLEQGMHRGCLTVGGMDMLIRQAELSWEIWQDR